MAIPGMNKEVKDPLLHAPPVCCWFAGTNNEAAGEVKTLEAAFTHSRLLMTIDSLSVSVVKEESKEHTGMQELRDQVVLPTEQVASLSPRQSGYQQQRRPHCFICGQIGHVQRNYLAQSSCPVQGHLCISRGQPDHLARNCLYQGNEQGMPAQGNRCPRL